MLCYTTLYKHILGPWRPALLDMISKVIVILDTRRPISLLTLWISEGWTQA